jgi:ankyrin repeat protein
LKCAKKKILQRKKTTNVVERKKMDINQLIEAAKRGHDEQIAELIRGGSDPRAVDSLGCTALHWAASGGHDAAVSLLVNTYKVPVNQQNKGGDTALHKASWRNHSSTCQILVNAGGDRETKNNEGKTPYDLARVSKVKAVLAPPLDELDEDEFDEDSD